MSELTVRISQSTHEMLLQLAETSGESIQIVLDKAIETYRRQVFLLQVNQAFVVLRQNETLWQEELEERRLWEQATADGEELE